MQPAGPKMSSQDVGAGPPLTTRYRILKPMAFAVVDRLLPTSASYPRVEHSARTQNHVHVDSGRTCRQSETRR